MHAPLRQASVIATCDMIALHPRTLTLTLFNTSELFQLAMKAFHIPTDIASGANDVDREIGGRIVRDDPVTEHPHPLQRPLSSRRSRSYASAGLLSSDN